jgi:hypothetical protein
MNFFIGYDNPLIRFANVALKIPRLSSLSIAEPVVSFVFDVETVIFQTKLQFRWDPALPNQHFFPGLELSTVGIFEFSRPDLWITKNEIDSSVRSSTHDSNNKNTPIRNCMLGWTARLADFDQTTR